MPHNLDENLVRAKLVSYLTGETSLSAFQRWFVSGTWDVDERDTKGLQELVYGIKLRLAEYTSGHWSRAGLREALLPFITSVEISPIIEGVEIASAEQKKMAMKIRSAARTISFPHWRASPEEFLPLEAVKQHVRYATASVLVDPHRGTLHTNTALPL